MKIHEILAEGKPALSPEVSLPKTEDTYDSVEKAVVKIAKLKPSFMGVTYRAGGGTSNYTVGIISAVKEEYAVTPLAYPTCVSSTREKVYHALGKPKGRDIKNILIPRGDIPQDGNTPKGYHYTSELIRKIRKTGGFCTGITCRSKGHVESTSKSVNTDYLKQEVEVGCDSIATQVFFDNSTPYSYLYRIREKGIQAPATTGIMPVTNAKQMRRITQMPGTCLPFGFTPIVSRFGDNPVVTKQAGITYATDQTTDLIINGVGGIHVYPMDKPDAAIKIKGNLSETSQGDSVGPDTERENEYTDIYDVDRGETLHYLGYKGQGADEVVTVMVEQFMVELWEAATSRHLYRECPPTLGEDYRVDGGCLKARSRNLWGNPKDCDQIIVFAATLDCGADHLIQKRSRLQMSRAVVIQATATAVIEGYCDQVCIVIKSEYEAKSRYLRPRFSPGYGDFPLECQGMLLEVLEAGERIGIKLTDSLPMTPSKSVSAAMGASRKPYRCDVKGCEACVKTNCPYRR